jgi:hypothetical protein
MRRRRSYVPDWPRVERSGSSLSSEASVLVSRSADKGTNDELGIALRARLRTALAPFGMNKDVRGEGLFTGIEFQVPRNVSMRLSFEPFQAIHPALFGKIVVMRLFTGRNILTQICGNNIVVLKVAPPLVVTEQQLIECITSFATWWNPCIPRQPSGPTRSSWAANLCPHSYRPDGVGNGVVQLSLPRRQTTLAGILQGRTHATRAPTGKKASMAIDLSQPLINTNRRSG